MNRIQRDTLLGLVFFGTLGFLLWATVNLSDVSLGKVPPLRVLFRDVGGVRIGDPVLVLGKRIGKVGEIEFMKQRSDENRMQLVLRIQEDPGLTELQKIEIQSTGVLGGKQVYIDPGRGQPWPPERELIGGTAVDPLASAGDFFAGKGAAGEELLGAVKEFRGFFRNLNDPDTTVGAVVRRRELYDEILAGAQSLRRIFQSVEDGEGALGRIVKDTNLRDDLLHIVQNLARVSDRLNATDSAVGRLLNDRDMAQQLASIVSNIDGIVTGIKDGRGFAGKLLSDQDLADKFGDAISSLASVLKKADDPQAGLFGALFGDLELRSQVKQVAANLASVSDKLDNGKGALGILISDEDVGIRLRRIFNQVARVLEDARESAPIGNFVQVLLGSF